MFYRGPGCTLFWIVIGIWAGIDLLLRGAMLEGGLCLLGTGGIILYIYARYLQAKEKNKNQ